MSTPTTGQIPAGWYPNQTDPSQGPLWNGNKWTSGARVMPRPPAAPAPGGSMPAPTHLVGRTAGELAREVARHTGKAPSAAALASLGSFLLPREPIVTAVTGWVGNKQSYLLGTPLCMIFIRGGRKGWLEELRYAQVTGWQMNHKPRGAQLVLSTMTGTVELSRIDDVTQTQACVHTFDRIGAQLTANGLPIDFAQIDAARAELRTALAHVMSGDELVSRGDYFAAGRRVLDICAAAVNEAGDPTLLAGLMLLTLGMECHVVRAGERGDAVRGIIDRATSSPDLTKPFPVYGGTPDQRRHTASALADLVRQFGGLLPYDAQDARHIFARVAREIVEAGPSQETQPVGQSGPSDDLVGRLERLGALYSSGVLTDVEFADMKARILDEARRPS